MRLKIGYIDISDGCWRRYMLVTTKKCCWQFWSFWSPTFTISLHYVGHQESKDVTNIHKSSTTFSRQHPYFTNIDVALKLPEYSTGQWPVPFTQISFQTWKFHTESPENPSSGSLVSLLWFLKWPLIIIKNFLKIILKIFLKIFCEFF